MKKITTFFVLLFCISCINKEQNFTLFTENLFDLSKESSINVNGFNVGKIMKINFDNNKVFLNVAIREDFDIPSDSKFIEYHSILGNSSISIKLGKELSFLRTGDTLELFSEEMIFSKKIDTINKIVEKALDDIIEVIEKDSIK